MMVSGSSLRKTLHSKVGAKSHIFEAATVDKEKGMARMLDRLNLSVGEDEKVVMSDKEGMTIRKRSC